METNQEDIGREYLKAIKKVQDSGEFEDEWQVFIDSGAKDIADLKTICATFYFFGMERALKSQEE